MPEMPEVETMVSRLQSTTGWTIVGSSVDPRMTEKARKKYLPKLEQFDINGQVINGVFRRAKYIVFMMDRGALLAHNAMSGYWDEADVPWTFDYVEGARESSETDIRVTLKLQRNSDTRTLQFHDSRMFGSIRYVTPTQLAEKLSSLGAEMISSKHLYEPSAVLTESVFINLLKKYKKTVKEFLMEQNRVAGVGNIYAAEALWAAKINPFRPANSLTDAEASQLFCSTGLVLESALNRKLDYSGLNVYRREICPAVNCHNEIADKKLKGRTTYWCPSCQP